MNRPDNDVLAQPGQAPNDFHPISLPIAGRIASERVTPDQRESEQNKDIATDNKTSDPAADTPKTILFDPGLQPERTKLSWSRTLLLLLLVTGAIVKVISAQNSVLGGSLLACSFGFAVFFSVTSQRKYARFLNAKSVTADGLLCLLIAAYVTMLGSFSLAWILF